MTEAKTRDPRGAIIDFLGYQIATRFLGYVDTCEEHVEEIRAWAKDGHIRPKLEEIADAILAIAIPDEPRLRAALDAERAKVAALAAALEPFAEAGRLAAGRWVKPPAGITLSADHQRAAAVLAALDGAAGRARVAEEIAEQAELLEGIGFFEDGSPVEPGTVIAEQITDMRDHLVEMIRRRRASFNGKPEQKS